MLMNYFILFFVNANHSDFYRIIMILKSDLCMTILDLKVTANKDFEIMFVIWI